jgi:hypothetical protein
VIFDLWLNIDRKSKITGREDSWSVMVPPDPAEYGSSARDDQDPTIWRAAVQTSKSRSPAVVHGPTVVIARTLRLIRMDGTTSGPLLIEALLVAASTCEMDGDVGCHLDRLRQNPHDPVAYLVLLRGRQLQVGRDG